VQALPGIGIVSAGVPELVFIDADDCLDPTTGAVINAAAERLLDECGHTYAEITPSRTGLRIIGTAPDIPTSLGHKGTVPGGLKLEVYKNTARFLTVTGGHRADHPDALGDIGPVVSDLLPLFGASRDRPGEGGKDARETAQLVRRIVTGEGYHNELCALAARLVGQGTRPDTAVQMLRGIMLAHTEDHRDQRWHDRYKSINKLVVSAKEKFATETQNKRRRVAAAAWQALESGASAKEIADAAITTAQTVGLSLDETADVLTYIHSRARDRHNA
jgi:hypothetical protein